MLQHYTSAFCNAPIADPRTQRVSGTMVNVHTARNSMQKNVGFTILKSYFRHKIVSRMKSKVNSPLKIIKLFQFQNSVFPTVSNGCCSLLQRLKFKYQYFTQCTTDRAWNILWVNLAPCQNKQDLAQWTQSILNCWKSNIIILCSSSQNLLISLF